MTWPRDLESLLRDQSGVLSRSQALATGLDDKDLRRLVRRRELVRHRPGIYLDHTGPATWQQQAWSAVLLSPPAALRGPSALRALERQRLDEPFTGTVHLAVDETRRVSLGPGIALRRVTDLSQRVLWNASPPRMRTEEVLLDVAAEASSEIDAVAVLADAVQRRLTTPRRLLVALQERSRISRRTLLHGVLGDLEEGTASVLEHGYLVRVERAHGLPRGLRQASLPGRASRHDVLYRLARIIVELDSRLFHDLAAARANDLERDLAAAAADHVTVRLGWSQVFATACATAEQLLRMLRLRGWRGQGRSCADCS